MVYWSRLKPGGAANLSWLDFADILVFFTVRSFFWLFQDKMPRKHKRKTNRGNVPEDILKRAADSVANGQTIQSVSKDFNVNRMTLTRYISKRQNNPDSLIGYKAVAATKTVIPFTMEKDLADHVKLLANMFHGLSPRKCCELAYEFAVRNK